jgi:hypothetical protein
MYFNIIDRLARSSVSMIVKFGNFLVIFFSDYNYLVNHPFGNTTNLSNELKICNRCISMIKIDYL